MFPKCSGIKHLVKGLQKAMERWDPFQNTLDGDWTNPMYVTLKYTSKIFFSRLPNDAVDIRDGMTLDLRHCLDALQYLNQLMLNSVGDLGETMLATSQLTMLFFW